MEGTHQSLHCEQWIMGDPSSGFLQRQYVFEPFFDTLALPDEPFILTFSFSSLCAVGSGVRGPALADWRVRIVVVRVDIVVGT